MSEACPAVFFVDDHAMVREGLATLVTRTGRYTVAGQADGQDGTVERIVQAGPDVIVLDLRMPGPGGLEILRRVSLAVPGTPVLVLSMLLDEEFVASAFRGGAMGYLTKDAAPAHLVEALDNVLARRRYVSPAISSELADNPDRDLPDLVALLTPRERQILELIVEGMTNRRAAEALGIAHKTVDTHRVRLMRKLGIHDQTSLVRYALSHGITGRPKGAGGQDKENPQ